MSGYGSSYPFGVGGDFSRTSGVCGVSGVVLSAVRLSDCPAVCVGEPPALPLSHQYLRQRVARVTQASPASASARARPRLFVHGGYHDASNPPSNPAALVVPIVLMTTYEVFPQDFTSNQFNIPNQLRCGLQHRPRGQRDSRYPQRGELGPDVLYQCAKHPERTGRRRRLPVRLAHNAGPPWGTNFDQETPQSIPR